MRNVLNTVRPVFAVANEGANKANNFKANIEGMIADVIKADASLATILAALSRDLLVYVPETGDIGMVNRLLKGLSKGNRNVMFLYFKNFLEWDHNEAGEFTVKMAGKRKLTNIESERLQWLKAEGHNVWGWEKARRVIAKPTPIQVKERAVNRITNAVKNGLTEVKLTPLDIMHILTDAGVTVAEIVKLADVMKSEAEQADKAKVAEAAKPKAEAKPKKPANLAARKPRAIRAPKGQEQQQFAA